MRACALDERGQRSPIFCAGGTSLETCSCGNFWVPVVLRRYCADARRIRALHMVYHCVYPVVSQKLHTILIHIQAPITYANEHLQPIIHMDDVCVLCYTRLSCLRVFLRAS